MTPHNIAYVHAGRPAWRAALNRLRYLAGLDTAASRRTIAEIINLAINRKAGWPDRPINHRGLPCRNG